LSNITAGTQAQVAEVVASGAMPRVLEIARTDVNEVRKEAMWVIANACMGGSEEHIATLYGLGAIPVLVEMLGSHDGESVSTVLDALRAILHSGSKSVARGDGTNVYCRALEEAGGLDKLEELQVDSNQKIYDKSCDILKKYFQAEEDEATEIATAPVGGYNFVAPLDCVFPIGGCTQFKPPPRLSSSLRDASMKL